MQNVNNEKICELVSMLGEPGVAAKETAEYMAKRDAWLNKSNEEIEFNGQIARLESNLNYLIADIQAMKMQFGLK